MSPEGMFLTVIIVVGAIGIFLVKFPFYKFK